MPDHAAEAPWYQLAPMPALLRHARAAYGASMRRALAVAGHGDIPGNGLYVIGALAFDDGAPQADLARQLGVGEQAAGKLLDALAARGYLVRAIGENGAATASLTDRGRAAAAVQSAARAAVDAELLAACGPGDVDATRRTLAVLCHIGRPDDDEGDDDR